MILFARRGKRTTIAAALVVFVTTTSGTILAQQASPPADPQPSLKPADVDGDGLVSRAEWSRMAQNFGRMDRNEDGALDLEELRAAAGETTAEPLFLKAADTNADDKIIRAEWQKLIASFTRWDANKDGALSLAEIPQSIGVVGDVTKAKAGSTEEKKIDEKKSTPLAATGPQLWRGWIVDGRGDQPGDRREEIELMIVGNRIVGREVGVEPSPYRQGLGSGTFVMNGNGKTGTLDAQYTEGPHAGQVCLGIFQLEEDRLRWCVSNRDGYRPPDFVTGSGCWLMLLRKVQNPPAK